MPAERTLPPISETAATAGTAASAAEDFRRRQLAGARRQLIVERSRGQSAFIAPTEGGRMFGETAEETTPNPVNQAQFSEALKGAVQDSVSKKREEMLSAPESFDNQLLIRRGALLATLLGEQVTPEELRWLSPRQQALIRDGKEDAIKAELAGIGSIMDGRRELKKEEDEREKKQARVKREERADALTRFNTMAKFKILDQLSPEGVVELDSLLEMPSGSIQSIIEQAEEDEQGEWELRSGAKGSLMAIRLNKQTGESEVKQVIGQTVAGGGGGGGAASDVVEALIAGLPVTQIPQGQRVAATNALQAELVKLKTKATFERDVQGQHRIQERIRRVELAITNLQQEQDIFTSLVEFARQQAVGQIAEEGATVEGEETDDTPRKRKKE